MPEAYSKDRNAARERVDELDMPGVERMPRSGAEDKQVRLDFLNVIDHPCSGTDHCRTSVQAHQILIDDEDETVEGVDEQSSQTSSSPVTAQYVAPSLVRVSRHSFDGTESDTTPADARRL